ncbi:Zn-ribbon domain-containing OB-fold protein [Pseudonocardia alni]|uniref:Zn-ribbon domain-containing OB-fold protein n=1 Tax=Pseudonocardia alni TaxID=33907 RepID=UPI00332A283A
MTLPTGQVVGQFVTTEPDIDIDTAGWWTSLADGELRIPHCTECDHAFFPPMPTCPHCGSGAVQQRLSTGEGEVYSWIVVHVALDPLFRDESPYTIVAVDMAEGARIFGRIACGPVTAGMPVRATPYVVGETTLLGFERV